MWPVHLIWRCDRIRDPQQWDWDSLTFNCNSITPHGAEEGVRSPRLLGSDEALSLCDPREVQSLWIQGTVSQEIIITAADLLPALCLFLESLLLSSPSLPCLSSLSTTTFKSNILNLTQSEYSIHPDIQIFHRCLLTLSIGVSWAFSLTLSSSFTRPLSKSPLGSCSRVPVVEKMGIKGLWKVSPIDLGFVAYS